MTPEQAAFLCQFILPQLRDETKTTHRVLSAVPNDACSYQPHETCMDAIKLAKHIAFADVMFLEAVINGNFGKPDDKAFSSLEKASDVADAYQEKIAPLLKSIESLTPEQLSTPIAFHTFNFPAVVYLEFMQKHMVHHRGQLTAYLRPMGAKVPSIYGGSADEPMSASA